MNYWIFKCNPKRYGLTDRLVDPASRITWLVTRYRKQIDVGDTVFLLETGSKRAIRAVVTVTVSPHETEELESERAYWKEPDFGKKWRIEGTITHRVELPITEIEAVDGLLNLSIIKGWQQGTNFRVSTHEGEILMEIIQNMSPQN